MTGGGLLPTDTREVMLSPLVRAQRLLEIQLSETWWYGLHFNQVWSFARFSVAYFEDIFIWAICSDFGSCNAYMEVWSS